MTSPHAWQTTSGSSRCPPLPGALRLTRNYLLRLYPPRLPKDVPANTALYLPPPRVHVSPCPLATQLPLGSPLSGSRCSFMWPQCPHTSERLLYFLVPHPVRRLPQAPSPCPALLVSCSGSRAALVCGTVHGLCNSARPGCLGWVPSTPTYRTVLPTPNSLQQPWVSVLSWTAPNALKSIFLERKPPFTSPPPQQLPPLRAYLLICLNPCRFLASSSLLSQSCYQISSSWVTADL